MITAVGDLSGIKNGEWPAIDKFEDPQLLARLLNAGLDPNITTKKEIPSFTNVRRILIVSLCLSKRVLMQIKQTAKVKRL